MLNFSALTLYSQWWVALDIDGGAPCAPTNALPKFAEHIVSALLSYFAPHTILETHKSDPGPKWKWQG